MDVAPLGTPFTLVEPVEFPADTLSNVPRLYGDGRGEVIPTFDGTGFRQYERRDRLFVSNTRVAQKGGLLNFEK